MEKTDVDRTVLSGSKEPTVVAGWVLGPRSRWVCRRPRGAGIRPPDGREQASACQAPQRLAGVGRRDHAILLLLARLGLRGGEVAALTLDDLDWAKGLVTLSGKGQRREALPLPEEVGKALVAYLRDGRPPCATRRVFVRAMAGPVPGLPLLDGHLRHRAPGAGTRGNRRALEGRASPAPLAGLRDAPQRRFARRDRADPAPSPSRDHPESTPRVRRYVAQHPRRSEGNTTCAIDRVEWDAVAGDGTASERI